MRPIKFRIWDNLKKQWCSNQAIWRLRTDIQGRGEIQPPSIYWGQDPSGLTIQQFTGMQDHNGVDVYEGDILTSYLRGQEPEVVVFEHGCFYLTKPDTWTLHDYLTSHNGFRVIGNILENPELMGTAK